MIEAGKAKHMAIGLEAGGASKLEIVMQAPDDVRPGQGPG